MDYFDSYGLMRMNKFHPVENGILFTAYHRLFGGDLDWIYFKAMKSAEPYKNEDHFIANPPERGERFSHDNMKAYYYLNKNIRGSVKGLPIFKWNDRIWWHPNGWAVFLGVRYKVFNKLFYPLIMFLVWFSYKFSPENDTSGKNLWVLCLNMLDYKIPSFIDDEEIYINFKYYITNGYSWENYDNPLYQLVEKHQGFKR